MFQFSIKIFNLKKPKYCQHSQPGSGEQGPDVRQPDRCGLQPPEPPHPPSFPTASPAHLRQPQVCFAQPAARLPALHQPPRASSSPATSYTRSDPQLTPSPSFLGCFSTLMPVFVDPESNLEAAPGFPSPGCVLCTAQGLCFGRVRTPSSRLITGLFCRWETRPPSVNVTNQAYLIHYSLTAAASQFQLLLEGELMPEMSRWHHVTGGIDLVPLGLMSLPFSGTHGEHTRVPAVGQVRTGAPSQPHARPWHLGIALGIVLQTVTLEYLL